jgi:hypothetical protein
MSYSIRFSRSNLFKVVPDKEDAFQRWAQESGLGVKQFLENGEKVFGIWPKDEDEGCWPYPPEYEDHEDAYEDDDPQMIVARSLGQFLRDGSVAILADVGAGFSRGDTISVGASAIAVNNKGEIIEWHLADILKMAERLGGECMGFEWRGSTAEGQG